MMQARAAGGHAMISATSEFAVRDGEIE